MKRPFVTHYYVSPDASGKAPTAVGYAATVQGARRNMAVRIVLGQYGLAAVSERAPKGESTVPLCIMRRTEAGLSITSVSNR